MCWPATWSALRWRCGRPRPSGPGMSICGWPTRAPPSARPLPGANVAFGGVMGQGKSNAARVVMAGAALDPLAELWVFVFANNGDFDAYRPRLARYHRGIDDTVAAAALQALRDLYEKVAQREARLAELG